MEFNTAALLRIFRKILFYKQTQICFLNEYNEPLGLLDFIWANDVTFLIVWTGTRGIDTCFGSRSFAGADGLDAQFTTSQ
jgi:hypothetical protein